MLFESKFILDFLEKILLLLETKKYLIWFSRVIRNFFKLPKKILNPNIFIKSDDMICEISKDNRVVRIDRIIIKALADNIEQYKTAIIRTRAEKIVLSLESRGCLNQISTVKDKDEYIITLPEQLKKGEESEIILRWDIANLTEAPFSVCAYGNGEGIEHARFVIFFPKEHLRNIRLSKYAIGSIKPFDKRSLSPRPFPSLDYPKQQVVWEIGKGTKDEANIYTEYRIDWDWASDTKMEMNDID